jgi:hypothetical protein
MQACVECLLAHCTAYEAPTTKHNKLWRATVRLHTEKTAAAHTLTVVGNSAHAHTQRVICDSYQRADTRACTQHDKWIWRQLCTGCIIFKSSSAPSLLLLDLFVFR